MTKPIVKNAQTRMGRVLRARVAPDPAYVDTLRKNAGWMTARSVAAAHGHSGHAVAHALRKLTEMGKLEEDILDVAGTARSREHMRVYRARPLTGETRLTPTPLPGWVEPQGVVAVGELRRIDGRAGMKRWRQAEPVVEDEEKK